MPSIQPAPSTPPAPPARARSASPRQPEPESPWRTLDSACLSWSDHRSIRESLTPATRAGLLQALERIDAAGLHFYGHRQVPLVKVGWTTPLTPAETLKFVESQCGWFQSDRLSVSHDGQKQFPVWSVHDLQGLDAITRGCAAAGISAPQLAAAIASLEAHGVRLYRYQSSDEGREPLDPLRAFNGSLVQVQPSPDKNSPIDADLPQVLALDFMQGSGVDRGLADPVLAAALKALQSDTTQFAGHYRDGAASTYLALLRGQDAVVETGGLPFFQISRELMTDRARFDAYVARLQGLYARGLSDLVAAGRVEKYAAGQMLQMALNPSPQATAEEIIDDLTALADLESSPGNASKWGVLDAVKSSYARVCAAIARSADRRAAVQDFMFLRGTLRRDAVLPILKRLYAAAPGQDFAVLRLAVRACGDFFTDDAQWRLLTDGMADGSLAARADLLALLTSTHGHRVAETFQAILSATLPDESAARTIQRYEALHESLTPQHRPQAVDTLQALQQAIGRGDVSADAAVARFQQLYVLGGDPQVALLRLGAPEAAPVGGVQQAVESVIINGLRIPRNLH